MAIFGCAKRLGWLVAAMLAAGLAAGSAAGCGDDDASSDAADSGSGGSGGGGSQTDSGTSDASVGTDADVDETDASTSACDAEIPDTWDGADFDTNAADQLALRGRLQALNTRMQEAEVADPPATTVGDLETLFEDGDPSVSDAMTTTYAAVTAQVFASFVAAVGSTLDPAASWDPSPANDDVGGRLCGPSGDATSGCWLMSAGGVDLRQIFEKGAFQAAMYNQAQALASSNVTPATIDQIAALFGANADLDIDGTNVHAANYAKGVGFYGTIRTHLIAAKAYAQAGDDCATELDDELSALLAAWEQSQFARFVYYANRALERFSSGTATEAENAEALHWLGEGLGLVWGFEGLPADSRIATDAQIEEILMLMKLPSIPMAKLYEFRVGNVEDLEDIEESFELIQDIYDFTDTQMNDQFRVHPTTPG